MLLKSFFLALIEQNELNELINEISQLQSTLPPISKLVKVIPLSYF